VLIEPTVANNIDKTTGVLNCVPVVSAYSYMLRELKKREGFEMVLDQVINLFSFYDSSLF